MEDQQIQQFFAEVKGAFHFLEEEYGYQHVQQEIENPDEGRDRAAMMRYAGSHVGVEINWCIADTDLGVSFVELLQPFVFPQPRSLFLLTRPHVARAISLYSLAEVLGFENDADFLLKSNGKPRQRYKRMNFIATHIPEIVAGLAHITQNHAANILKGDTSIFAQVMEYHLAQHKQLYPDMFIHRLKLPD